ncbi:hypothetical protein KDK_57480 [Dictyobacter kobayashii]|uniref:Uncharacterized protein n=1 Tax=Dictyobacter kobayashii TaxID=2014872 RepID=A0A402AS60_9CHLR|nr:hypothetical protein KDK_57480 [Dictyobacter kobayashii]
MTPGVTEETADGHSLETFEAIIAALKRNDISGNQREELHLEKEREKETARHTCFGVTNSWLRL